MLVKALSYLFSPIGRLLAMAGLVVMFVAVVFVRGRKAGVLSERSRQQREIQRAEKRFNEIDNQRPDVNGAYERLRERSKTSRR